MARHSVGLLIALLVLGLGASELLARAEPAAAEEEAASPEASLEASPEASLEEEEELEQARPPRRAEPEPHCPHCSASCGGGGGRLGPGPAIPAEQPLPPLLVQPRYSPCPTSYSLLPPAPEPPPPPPPPAPPAHPAPTPCSSHVPPSYHSYPAAPPAVYNHPPPRPVVAYAPPAHQAQAPPATSGPPAYQYPHPTGYGVGQPSAPASYGLGCGGGQPAYDARPRYGSYPQYVTNFRNFNYNPYATPEYVPNYYGGGGGGGGGGDGTGTGAGCECGGGGGAGDDDDDDGGGGGGAYGKFTRRATTLDEESAPRVLRHYRQPAYYREYAQAAQQQQLQQQQQLHQLQPADSGAEASTNVYRAYAQYPQERYRGIAAEGTPEAYGSEEARQQQQQQQHQQRGRENLYVVYRGDSSQSDQQYHQQQYLDRYHAAGYAGQESQPPRGRQPAAVHVDPRQHQRPQQQRQQQRDQYGAPAYAPGDPYYRYEIFRRYAAERPEDQQHQRPSHQRPHYDHPRREPAHRYEAQQSPESGEFDEPGPPSRPPAAATASSEHQRRRWTQPRPFLGERRVDEPGAARPSVQRPAASQALLHPRAGDSTPGPEARSRGAAPEKAEAAEKEVDLVEDMEAPQTVTEAAAAERSPETTTSGG